MKFKVKNTKTGGFIKSLGARRFSVTAGELDASVFDDVVTPVHAIKLLISLDHRIPQNQLEVVALEGGESAAEELARLRIEVAALRIKNAELQQSLAAQFNEATRAIEDLRRVEAERDRLLESRPATVAS